MNLNELKKIITKATRTTISQPEQTDIQQIKNGLKNNKLLINDCFRVLMDRSNARHSQARLNALHITHEIFMRSADFRRLICENLATFVNNMLGLYNNTASSTSTSLVVSSNSNSSSRSPLPPPKMVAQRLRATGIG